MRRCAAWAVNTERRRTPLLLAEQLLAWRMYRHGDLMQQIAYRIRRPVTETRSILFGDRLVCGDGWATPRFEAAYAGHDWGYPVEEWVYGGIHLTLHFERDGSLEVFADAGDWDCAGTLAATSIEAGRAEAFAWIDALPREQEKAA